MSKNSKTYRAATEKVNIGRVYFPLGVTSLTRGTSSKSCDATIDVVIHLGVDPRKADQLVRGTASPPSGTGKTARVVAFATGKDVTKVGETGVGFVSSEELIEKIQDGWTGFDVAIAALDQMARVGRVTRIPGPRGLMPNPKTDTVIPDIAKAVTEIKGGKISSRVDKAADLQAAASKASFDAEKLAESYGALIDELMRLKPSVVKGEHLKKATVSTTNGPGILADTNVIKDYTT